MRFILIRLCEANGWDVCEQAALLPGREASRPTCLTPLTGADLSVRVSRAGRSAQRCAADPGPLRIPSLGRSAMAAVGPTHQLTRLSPPPKSPAAAGAK